MPQSNFFISLIITTTVVAHVLFIIIIRCHVDYTYTAIQSISMATKSVNCKEEKK